MIENIINWNIIEKKIINYGCLYNFQSIEYNVRYSMRHIVRKVVHFIERNKKTIT